MDNLKLLSKNTKIWFTSDTHYWHNNITYGVSTWDNKETNTRKFDTVHEMSRHIVDQINKYVGQDDILFHLGDWSFGGTNNIWNFKKQIICKNIYLILGNHDSAIRKNLILSNCKRSYPYSINIIDGKCIGGEYPDYVEARSIFEGVYDYLEIQIDKKDICMMHYPIESWNRGFIHLFGHCHSKLPIKEGRLDVGIDNAFKLFGEYKPFSWEEIKKLIK